MRSPEASVYNGTAPTSKYRNHADVSSFPIERRGASASERMQSVEARSHAAHTNRNFRHFCGLVVSYKRIVAPPGKRRLRLDFESFANKPIKFQKIPH